MYDIRRYIPIYQPILPHHPVPGQSQGEGAQAQIASNQRIHKAKGLNLPAGRNFTNFS